MPGDWLFLYTTANAICGSVIGLHGRWRSFKTNSQRTLIVAVNAIAFQGKTTDLVPCKRFMIFRWYIKTTGEIPFGVSLKNGFLYRSCDNSSWNWMLKEGVRLLSTEYTWRALGALTIYHHFWVISPSLWLSAHLHDFEHPQCEGFLFSNIVSHP